MLSPYDPALALERRQTDWRECVVHTADPLTVRDGAGDPVRARMGIPGWQPAQGDRVVVQRLGAELVVSEVLTVRPPRGTVVAASAGIATVSAGGRVWDLAYLGTTPPAVGATVRILWDSDGGTVLGTITTNTPAPDVPPVDWDVPAAGVTLDLRPTDWASYRGGSRDDASATGLVRQGYWTGYAAMGAYSGLWVYGDVLGGVQGRTCTGLTVDLSRAAGIGASAARPVHLWLHNHRTIPATPTYLGAEHTGVSIAAGTSGTYPLPAEWGTQLAAGTAAGIGIQYTGETDYMGLHGPDVAGSGTLHGTWH